MYSRDPFNVRNKGPASPLLRTTSSFRDSAAQATQRAFSAAETLFEGGRKAVQQDDDDNRSSYAHATSMTSYALPNGGAASHATDVWQSSSRSRFQHDSDSNAGIGEKVSNMFSSGRKDSLPMYKDKPYHYSKSQKRMPWYRQRRIVMGALTVFAIISWWTGIFSPLSYLSRKSSGTKSSETKTSEPKTMPTSTGWSFWGGKETINWAERADNVKDAFKISFSDYRKNGWGYDEYHPVSKSGKHMVPQGMGWIIVDALDTMMLMNLTAELTEARHWIYYNLTYDQDHDVNTFETTIRMLGGLLSAHYLSTSFPGVYAPVDDGISDDLYLERAADLADRLLGAYETQSGIPLASVNLHTMKGIPSHADGGASSTAEATSLQLEMKYLAKLTGETHYWEHVEHVMKAVDDNHAPDGLVPIFIYADRGAFRGDNIRLGSRGDSYYEYLIKQYLQTKEKEPVYKEMWSESMAGIKKHLITYSSPNNWTVLAEKPNGLGNAISAKMDHLVCFMPGTIALAATGGLPLAKARKQRGWGEQQEEDIRLAVELMKTCMGMYAVTPTGLAPEIVHFNIHDPPLMYQDFKPKDLPKSPKDFFQCVDKTCAEKESTGKDDFVIHTGDVHNLQRPETVESLFYMWRITGDETYRHWGWQMFQSFIRWTAVEDGLGFSSASNVQNTPPGLRDNMESFWLAETLKYFYLLFSDNHHLPLTDVVFNTEAHAFPRFDMGKLFKTGWKRNVPGDVLRDHEKAPGAQTTISITTTIQHEVEVAASTSTAAAVLEEGAAPLTVTDVATPEAAPTTKPEV